VVAGYDELDGRIDGLEHDNGRTKLVQLGLLGDISAMDGDVCACGDGSLQGFSVGVGEHKDSCCNGIHLVETAWCWWYLACEIGVIVMGRRGVQVDVGWSDVASICVYSLRRSCLVLVVFSAQD
jgi:hypothetical protein